MSLKRPNMLRFTSWMEECITCLAMNGTHPLDGVLVSWVRLMKITENIHISLSFEDLNQIVKLSEPSIQFQICGIEEGLELWRKRAQSEGINGLPNSTS